MPSPECGRLGVSITAVSLLLIGACFGVASLFAGPWVETEFPNVIDGKNITSYFGFGPGGLYFDPGPDQDNTLTPVSEIEANWDQHQLIFSPQPSKGVDGKSTAELLNNTYNLVAAGVVGCVTAVLVFLPFFLREIFGRLKVVKCCGKLEAVASGLAALGASVLLIAGFGLLRASQFRAEFVEAWNGLTVEMDNGATTSATSADTAVMDCSLAAAVLALFGALLIVLRGTLCTGVNDEDYETAEANPSKMRCAGIVSCLGFLILGVATFLSVASLGDGQWVVAVFSSQNGDEQTTVNFGCGPLGAGAFVKTPDSTSNTHYEVTEIEERWPILRPFLNPDNREAVTGKSTEELLTNTFKMMISAVVAGGAACILSIPIVVQQLCGGLSGLPTGVRVSSILAAFLGLAAAGLNGASYGIIRTSELRDGFVQRWDNGSFDANGRSVSLKAGDSDAMNAALGGAAFALVGALTILFCTTCCGGSATTKAR